MKLTIQTELLLLNALSLALILAVGLEVASLMRPLLGLPFLLLSPGYTLATALFPGKQDLGVIERMALSLGLSIAVVPLMGLALHYTPWGIRMYPVLFTVALFTAVMSALSWYRRNRLPVESRFQISVCFNGGNHTKLSGPERALSLFLVLLMLFGAGTLGYLLAAPREGERFTEFYLLGVNRKAEGYPQVLRPGEEGWVIVGVANRERETVTYRGLLRVEGQVKEWLGTITLPPDGRWERAVGFSLQTPGENAKVEFLLYREGSDAIYRSLHLWVDVVPGT